MNLSNSGGAMTHNRRLEESFGFQGEFPIGLGNEELDSGIDNAGEGDEMEDDSQSKDSYRDPYRDFCPTVYKQYFKLPLLTEEEEVFLGEKIQKAWTRIREIRKNIREIQCELPPHALQSVRENSRNEIKKQHLLIHDAVNVFLERNIRLVIKVAYTLRGRGLAIDDLVQEGFFGIWRAARRYDPWHKSGKNSSEGRIRNVPRRFYPFAQWWVRQTCGRAIADKSRIIRIPVYARTLLSKIERIETEIMREYPEQRYVFHEDIALKAEIPLKKVQEVLRYCRPPLSLNTPVGNESETTLESVLHSFPPWAEHRVQCKEEALRIISMLGAVKRYAGSILVHDEAERDLEIFWKSVEGGADSPSNVDLAWDYGFTREWVRRIINKVEQYLAQSTKKGNIPFPKDIPLTAKSLRAFFEYVEDLVKIAGCSSELRY